MPTPKGKPSGTRPAPDRTSAVVGATLALLAAMGTVTIFSGPLGALLSPPSSAEALPGSPERVPSGAAAGDAGSNTALGRPDGAAHS